LLGPINCYLVRLSSFVLLNIYPCNSSKASNEVYITVISEYSLLKLIT